MAVRDRSRRRRRLIVCLFDGRTKALRDKTSPPPSPLSLLSFALSFLSKGERARAGGREGGRGYYVKVAPVSSPPYGPPGAALKCLELFIARPREHPAVISTVN